ncbi:MAG: T9SS type A sorting domain-containing protein [Candidatus Stahlbacteria bacterium]|nr:T9SS type A sorting domain-containing protein [Candidatus Stahlbacteria bacterium]
MLRRFFMLIWGILFTIGVVHSDISGIQTCPETERVGKAKAMWEHQKESWLQKSISQKLKSAKGAPDYATYLAGGSGMFEPKVGANGYGLIWIEAKIPGTATDTTGNVRDTNYQDTVDLKVVEEYFNNSSKFYPSLPPYGLPDTANPVTSIKLDNGQVTLWIRDTEAENLIVWAIPRDSLKPTHPLPYTIDTSGTVATRIVIEGPIRTNVGGGWGARYIVKVADSLGHIVPGYGDFFDPTRVNIKVIESTPDSSAMVSDIMTGSSDSVQCTLIYGKAHIFLDDTTTEHLTLIATSNFGDLLPDTFEVDVIPSDQSTMIISMSFSGTYGTIGVDKNILALAIAPATDGPDPNNNTSNVEFKVFDIMGSSSASIHPSGPQTLTGGIAFFMLKETEADSGVIIQTIPSGIPELSPIWYEKLCYGFKLPGQAILIHANGPSTAMVNDTVTLYVYAVDANDSLDPTYDGWVWIEANDNNGSCQTLEYGTGVPQNIIHIQNGIGRAWVIDNEPERVGVYFEDAEGGDGPSDKYLGSHTPDEGIDISFELPGDSATHWVLDIPGNQFSTGYKVSGTIKAVDDSSRVDTCFNDTAHFLLTGFAVPSDTHIVVTKGIGMIEFCDDSVEKVAISVANAGLTPWTDSISFVSSGTAVWLVTPPIPGEVMVKDSVQISIYDMTAGFAIDTTWNGVIRIEYSDPGDTSISWSSNPDSIPIIKGMGTIKMTDSKAERVVYLAPIYVSGEPPLTTAFDFYGIEFEAKLWSDVPDTAMVGGAIDTMIFKTLDNNNLPTQYTTWCYIWCEEQIPNSSVVIDPSDSFQIINGIGKVAIENAEPETVWIHYYSDDPLIQYGDFVKRIVFKEAAVEEIPTQFAFSFSSPNPFRPGLTTIHYSCPSSVQVRLKIYDISGREVCTLIDRQEKPGKYTINWNGTTDNHKELSSGIYFCKFSAGNYRTKSKLILLK